MFPFRLLRKNTRKTAVADKYHLDLAHVTHQVVLEQKRLGKWKVIGTIAKTFFILVIVSIIFSIFSNSKVGNVYNDTYTALIDITGVIADGELASARNIIKALNVAIKDSNLQGIILNINSPGGSPVQAAQVFAEIKRLRELHNKPIYAVINDIGASGAYYIASAADKIYVNKHSLVGSIGVISQSFGFDEFIQEYKITRRTMTSGQNKAFLDPFAPESKDHKKYWQKILDDTHASFIADVKLGRGNRLNDTDSKIFSGLVYTGKQTLQNGLADALGDYFFVAREIIQEENIIEFQLEQDPIKNWISNINSSFIRAISNNLYTKPLS